jgi:membrane-bound metal-dependent hydrolase YbcI (DUF457 family)
MPSPVGHALGGILAGHLIGSGRLVSAFSGGSAPDGPGLVWTRRVPDRWRLWTSAGVCAALGILPDVDLAFGAHSMYTHSIGAVAVVLLLIAAAFRFQHWRIVLALTAAYASHLPLDWLGHDTTAPFGIMALWPFSDGYYMSYLNWFPPVDRRYWQDTF